MLSLKRSDWLINDSYSNKQNHQLLVLGKLGFVSKTQHNESPQQIPNIPAGVPVVQISCGNNWAAVLIESGRVYTWGENSDGQLGHGNTNSVNEPTRILAFKSTIICQVSCGTAHGAFITNEGCLYTSGCGMYGRLGTGCTKNAIIPRKVEVSASRAFVQYATLAGMLSNRSETGRPGSTRVAQPTTAKDIKLQEASDEEFLAFDKVSCGDRHTLVVTSTRNKTYHNCIFAFGDGSNGRLGTGDDKDRLLPDLVKIFKSTEGLENRRILHVSAGDAHSAAISTTGEVYTWGDGGQGRLGHGTSTSEWAPRRIEALNDVSMKDVVCGGRHTVAIDQKYRVFTWGSGICCDSDSNVYSPKLMQTLSEVKIGKIEAGKDHCVGIDMLTGGIYTWGQNRCGQLGHQDKDGPVSTIPEQIDFTKYQIGAGTEIGTRIVSCTANATFIIFLQEGIKQLDEDTLPEISTDVTVALTQPEEMEADNQTDAIVLSANSKQFNIPSKAEYFKGELSRQLHRVEELTEKRYNAAKAAEADDLSIQDIAMMLQAETIPSRIVLDPVSQVRAVPKYPENDVKGFDNWVKMHKLQRPTTPHEPVRPNSPAYRFNHAARFPASRRLLEATKTPQIVGNEIVQCKPTGEIIPYSKSYTFPKTPREAFKHGSRDHMDFPGPGQYDPRKEVCIRSPVGVKFNGQSSSHGSRSVEMSATSESTSLKSDSYKRVVYPTSASFSMGGGHEFSRVISRRLQEAKGALPGPGTYG